jgi:hypothetical protein
MGKNQLDLGYEEPFLVQSVEEGNRRYAIRFKSQENITDDNEQVQPSQR